MLVAAGILSEADLERGLARQRTTRTRLGSTLVEMGILGGDEIARALARQHGVPAALERHLAGRDPALVARLPAELARTAWVLPLAMSRGGDGINLVVCMRDPVPEAIALVRTAAGMPVIPSVAGELALRRHLDVAYPPPKVAPPATVAPPPRIDDGSDGSIDIDVDVDVGEHSRQFPVFSELGEGSLVELDHEYVDKHHVLQTPTVLRSTGSVPALGAATDAKRATGASPAIAAAPEPPPQQQQPQARKLDDTITSIAIATTQDQIAELAIDYLRGHWKAALVMTVKGKSALGQHGFGGGITATNAEWIVVPLDQPSVLRTAHDDRRPFVGDAQVGSTVQDRFLRLFADVGSRTLVVAPVMVRERPVSLLFAIGPLGKLPESAATVAVLAHAMGEAYLRIILAAKSRG